MKRNWNMDEVSDGKRYGKDDIVRVDCHGCYQCFACCKGMGNSVVLDPYDIYRMTQHFSCTIKELMESGVELTVVDGLILPSLKMTGEEETCYYLNEKGRCSIHEARPGICRMFPLGRIYREDGFDYFIQIHECSYEKKGEMRVRDWVSTPNLNKYEKYIWTWHQFMKQWQQILSSLPTEEEKKQYVMYLLMQFFNKPYDVKSDFYPQFYTRIEEAKNLIS